MSKFVQQFQKKEMNDFIVEPNNKKKLFKWFRIG